MFQRLTQTMTKEWLVTHDSWLVRCCCYGKVSDSSGDDSSIKQGLISCHGSLLTAGKNLERLIVSLLQEDRWVWAVQGDVMWWVAWKEAFLSLSLSLMNTIIGPPSLLSLAMLNHTWPFNVDYFVGSLISGGIAKWLHGMECRII